MEQSGARSCISRYGMGDDTSALLEHRQTGTCPGQQPEAQTGVHMGCSRACESCSTPITAPKREQAHPLQHSFLHGQQEGSSFPCLITSLPSWTPPLHLQISYLHLPPPSEQSGGLASPTSCQGLCLLCAHPIQQSPCPCIL